MTILPGTDTWYCGGFSQRSIATSLSCSRDAVALCIKRAKERGFQLPVSEDVTNEDLRKLLHYSQEGIRDPSNMLPVFFYVVKELEKSRPNENWRR